MSGAIDPGCVRLRLAVAGGRIGDVHVASERPTVAGLLRGRDADEAVRLVPLLFALCGRAQGRAAQLALAAARGGEHAAAPDPAIRREALREHLWRWLLDLPLLLGGRAMREEFVAALRRLEEDRRDELGGLLAGPGIADLVDRLAGAEDCDPPVPRSPGPPILRSPGPTVPRSHGPTVLRSGLALQYPALDAPPKETPALLTSDS